MIVFLKNWLAGAVGVRHAGASMRRLTTSRNAGNYRADLVALLRTEHRELLALLVGIERANAHADDDACRQALDRFTRTLREHLRLENRHLYGYFARQANPDRGTAARVAQMSGEMLQIGRELHAFIATYSRGAWSSARRMRLREDIRRVGDILRHRIREEETALYPLYQPPVV